ncbi:MAG: DNA polymerase III subunit alpha, partial [Flavobacteriales bacterium]
HLTYEGAKQRYGEITNEIKERIDFELNVIQNMGFPGYFLIVQDFTSKARELGVSIGPGRGSAAGSAVAYCTGITNVDPIKYKLLFERFLNPERVSMPDIDIDFDDEGRAEIINYVIEKYGHDQVAQIITYGSMAAKLSIRDTGRVLDLPLQNTDRVAKLMPDGNSLDNVLSQNINDLNEELNGDELAKAKELQKYKDEGGKEAEVLEQARIIEGSIRNTGIHPCGIIITPNKITEHIPVCTSKDSELLITQYDNDIVEDAGMLKMDFLGLRTLTIIKETVRNVKKTRNIDIDPENIPLDDEKTFELYRKGNTTGIFQFESPGMQKHLKNLKPNKIEDIIAMNALYRPGPMQYIDLYINRKYGKEEVEYPHPLLEDILKDTYGIMVFQEQIMQSAQKMAGFSLGKADILRKAMGKKKMDVMEKMKEDFVQGAKEKHNIEEKDSEQVFEKMREFAKYGFNRSHSTAYSMVAYQTAYMKAHYPAEFIAAVLTNNMNDIKKVTHFMDEAKRMGVKVLGPDINESEYKFVVNENGEVRFGLGALKGVGGGAVESIVNERKENGAYESIYDFIKRINLRSANKKTLESLALAGAYDSLCDNKRSIFFHTGENGSDVNFIDSLIRYASKSKERENTSQVSLFGDDGSYSPVPHPEIPDCEEWDTLTKLSKEKEVVGVYISGHPLDDHKMITKHFCTTNLTEIQELEGLQRNKVYSFTGIVTDVAHKTAKTGNPFGIIELEDYHENHKFFIFGDEYMRMKHLMVVGTSLFVKGKKINRYDKRVGDKVDQFRITEMELLAEVKDKIVRSMNLKLNLSDISDDLLEELINLLKNDNENNEEGKCQVYFSIKDDQDQ